VALSLSCCLLKLQQKEPRESPRTLPSSFRRCCVPSSDRVWGNWSNSSALRNEQATQKNITAITTKRQPFKTMWKTVLRSWRPGSAAVPGPEGEQESGFRTSPQTSLTLLIWQAGYQCHRASEHESAFPKGAACVYSLAVLFSSEMVWPPALSVSLTLRGCKGYV